MKRGKNKKSNVSVKSVAEEVDNSRNVKNSKTNFVQKKKIFSNKELREKLKEFAFTIDTVEDEKAEIEGKLKRALADYINLEVNMNKRMDIMFLQWKSKMALQVISVLDDVKFALEARKNIDLEDVGKVESWMDGVLGVSDGLDKALETLDVQSLNVKVGDKFDSAIHEAVGMVQNKVEAGKSKKTGNKVVRVVEVVQQGYAIKERVVRSARVICSK